MCSPPAASIALSHRSFASSHTSSGESATSSSSFSTSPPSVFDFLAGEAESVAEESGLKAVGCLIPRGRLLRGAMVEEEGEWRVVGWWVGENVEASSPQDLEGKQASELIFLISDSISRTWVAQVNFGQTLNNQFSLRNFLPEVASSLGLLGKERRSRLKGGSFYQRPPLTRPPFLSFLPFSFPRLERPTPR